jgi:hypothetical protein
VGTYSASPSAFPTFTPAATLSASPSQNLLPPFDATLALARGAGDSSYSSTSLALVAFVALFIVATCGGCIFLAYRYSLCPLFHVTRVHGVPVITLASHREILSTSLALKQGKGPEAADFTQLNPMARDKRGAAGGSSSSGGQESSLVLPVEPVQQQQQQQQQHQGQQGLNTSPSSLSAPSPPTSLQQPQASPQLTEASRQLEGDSHAAAARLLIQQAALQHGLRALQLAQVMEANASPPGSAAPAALAEPPAAVQHPAPPPPAPPPPSTSPAPSAFERPRSPRPCTLPFSQPTAASSSTDSAAEFPPPPPSSAAGIPCTESVEEGGQVYYLDGPEGPSLEPGWQRCTDKVRPTVHWYVRVVPPEISPRWDPPYAHIPSESELASGRFSRPFHPRVNGTEKFFCDPKGGKHFFDPKSGALLAAGWRSVTDGEHTWYGNIEEHRSQWEIPLYKP